MTGPYIEGGTFENTHLVLERDLHKGREQVTLVVAVLAVVATLVLYTWVHLEIRNTSYRIEALDSDLELLQRRERELNLEASYLESPERIEREAAEKLGMVGPRVEQLAFVSVE